MSAINFTQEISNLEGVLNNFAFKLTRNREDSKDLYQETAYRALVNQDKFRVGTNLKAWLFTMMRNIFINNYRKKIKRNTILDSTDNQFFLNSGGPAILNGAHSSMMMDELEELVDELHDSTRIPFMMHYYGYKYQEIAEQLDLPLGTIKSRIFFARKELKGAVLSNYKNVLSRTA
ncbi:MULTISPECIES: RNA polymerase sigma factor [unclassified Aureispira]|uniref:RNA polymerase sigma factor n=1 Tax=unclassified Aureispira TaxID=2649989 RepID=UPI0006972ED8|nr:MULTISPECIES: RNA polymerase sigma factor [unclassified Aureispira]WMX14035.1 RNA polymerase sigma factor [Aureispira sp. CCB-E]